MFWKHWVKSGLAVYQVRFQSCDGERNQILRQAQVNNGFDLESHADVDVNELGSLRSAQVEPVYANTHWVFAHFWERVSQPRMFSRKVESAEMVS